jgi:hypothetical protein
MNIKMFALAKALPAYFFWALCIFNFCCLGLHADIVEDLMHGVFTEGITVDLNNPTYTEGVLTTKTGGVIAGPGIRIQARKITYTRKMVDGAAVCTIVAEDDLMLEFGRYIFVGDRLEYDFQNSTGVIYNGRTSIGPWFVGGETVELCSDGSYIIYDAYITTSESLYPDWEITAKQASLKEERFLAAKDVKFKLFNIPVLWVPSFKTDFASVSEHPFQYYVGWGGRQGPRAGVAYELYSNELWKVFLHLDYRIRRGPGGGFETRYRSPDRKEKFETINYIARDVSIFNTHERTRYRFQGNYSNYLFDDKVSIEFTYDKLSDEDMAADYADMSLDLEASERTQLEIRREDEWWIANFLVRARINSFETVKQELPTFQINWRPFELGSTGIISDNCLEISYLDYAYAKQLPHRHNYHSARFELLQRFYKTFKLGNLVLTPEAGGVAIAYGNSPNEGSGRVAAQGLFGCIADIPFYKVYDWGKHVITPYSHYQYFTFPTNSPHDHYIFDISDGLYRLNMLRFGFNQSFYVQDCDGILTRYIYADLHANAFFHIKTIPETVQKIYSKVVWNYSPVLRHTLDTAWDLEERQLDHINLRTEWTVSADFAVSAEYRHRSSFDWRKADRENFILDCFRSVEELRHSQLSDRRDTALLHFFYRFHPKWAVEFISLSGWNRRDRTRYTEFEVDLIGMLQSACQVKLAFQHRQDETRFAIYFNIAAQGPDRVKSGDLIPSLSF